MVSSRGLGDVYKRQNLYLAARNIPHVDVVDAAAIDPVSLIAFDKVVMSVAAAKKIEVELG